jgi:hypothetical protein
VLPLVSLTGALAIALLNWTEVGLKCLGCGRRACKPDCPGRIAGKQVVCSHSAASMCQWCEFRQLGQFFGHVLDTILIGVRRKKKKRKQTLKRLNTSSTDGCSGSGKGDRTVS